MKGYLFLCLVLLSGCVSSNLVYQDGMKIQTVGETNAFRPSLSLMQVQVCVPADDKHVVDVIDGEEYTCNGEYKPIAVVQGTQAGAMTGLFSSAIQGGAIVGGAYLLGDGIRDSASQTNVEQSGGGANAESGSIAANTNSIQANPSNSVVSTGGAVSNSNKNYNSNSNKNYNRGRH